MRVTVNGAPRELAGGATVADLLTELGRHPRTVAVERNGEILPRRDYDATRLAEGDRLEVVHFVQGGNVVSPPGRWV
jgi:thiamine biosynthesis protein ThiS